MKKLVSFFLALTLCASLAVPALAAEFTDVPADHWAYSAIQTAAEKGITSGYSDGTFKPSAPVTNIQFVVMLSRAFYAEDVAQWAADAAASKNDWWWPNWYALTRRHLLTGNELFENRTSLREQGNQGITRQNMAWLLSDVLSEKGGSATEEQKAGAQAQIADYASIPAGYQEAVKTAFALGLITGYSDGTFGGDKTMNRAQGCIVIDRLAQYVGGGSGTGPAVPADDDLTEVPNSPGSTPAGQEASGNAENGTLTLRDGSAPTEENARKILETVMAAYPGENWTADSNRNDMTILNENRLGGLSEAIRTITRGRTTQDGSSVSLYGGCGGLASMASDAIFGGSGTGGENFPARKLSSVTEARTGDVYVHLKNGSVTHLGIIASVGAVTSRTDSRGISLQITRYDGGGTGGSTDTSTSIFDGTKNGGTYEVWTRYPD